ncbi:hypothetical protein [Gracilinema caldarium]|uniref:Porin n=1 Tax=Gracilinema caldarium (strain ATCC 51460 / DSM 7334 / H1) TaxID=744872 RepID=F8F3Y4_GRAC1|nr:hypothetical protein [Gracilinema caldarium]AEJ20503.1 hypothetical protein Spica_2393 [Gracilinema caldarium DSM 7334]
MKKALVMILSLTIVGAVIAQEQAVKVSGYVNTGLKMVNDGKSDDTGILLYGDDDGSNGVTAKITVEYTGTNVGAKVSGKWNSEPKYEFDVDSDGKDETFNNVSLDTAYGWVSPFEGLKAFAGTSYAGYFDGVDDDSNDYFDSKSVSVTYANSGFVVGAGVNPVQDTTNTNYIIGAAYKMDKLFDVRFSAITAKTEFDKYSISGSLLAVDKLTLTAGFLTEGLATDADKWMDLTVAYQVMDPLKVQVIAYDYLDKEYFTVTPSLSYKLNDNVTLSGQVKYQSEGKDKVANYESIFPKAKVSYTLDKATVNASVEYDTEMEKTTALIDFVYSF